MWRPYWRVPWPVTPPWVRWYCSVLSLAPSPPSAPSPPKFLRFPTFFFHCLVFFNSPDDFSLVLSRPGSKFARRNSKYRNGEIPPSLTRPSICPPPHPPLLHATECWPYEGDQISEELSRHAAYRSGDSARLPGLLATATSWHPPRGQRTFGAECVAATRVRWYTAGSASGRRRWRTSWHHCEFWCGESGEARQVQ